MTVMRSPKKKTLYCTSAGASSWSFLTLALRLCHLSSDLSTIPKDCSSYQDVVSRTQVHIMTLPYHLFEFDRFRLRTVLLEEALDYLS